MIEKVDVYSGYVSSSRRSCPRRLADISLLSFDSGATLAAEVGVLFEVPVILAVAKVVNSSDGW